MNGNKQIGELGEAIACQYLVKKEYKILERNYYKEISSVFKGEIDIIAKKNNIISFIEVKTSRDSLSRGFLPEDRVNYQKQAQLKKISQMWLSEKKISFESPWQIDVVSIIIGSEGDKPEISHFENCVC